jgi:hypothetical protein
VLMRMPFAFWDALAGIAEMLPRPSLTRNQVEPAGSGSQPGRLSLARRLNRLVMVAAFRLPS